MDIRCTKLKKNVLKFTGLILNVNIQSVITRCTLYCESRLVGIFQKTDFKKSHGSNKILWVTLKFFKNNSLNNFRIIMRFDEINVGS